MENSFFLPAPMLVMVIISIILALIITQFLPFKIDPLDSKFGTDRILNILYIVAGGIIFFIVLDFLNIYELENSSSLAPFGILISALMASTSIMKSIKNTNEIEDKKVNRELFDKRLDIYRAISVTHGKILGQVNITFEDIDDFYSKTRGVDLFFDEDIIKFVENENEDFLKFFGKLNDIEKKEDEIRIEESNKTNAVEKNESKFKFGVQAQVLPIMSTSINIEFDKRIDTLKSDKKKLKSECFTYAQSIIKKKHEMKKLFDKYLVLT